MGGSAAAPAPAQPAKAAAPRPAPEPMPSAVVADSTRGQLSIATDPLPDFLTSRAQGAKADPFTAVELTFSWRLPSAAAAFRRGAHRTDERRLGDECVRALISRWSPKNEKKNNEKGDSTNSRI